jgi:hypothetical protein
LAVSLTFEKYSRMKITILTKEATKLFFK